MNLALASRVHRLLTNSALSIALAASGCCAPMISGRYGEEPTCGAELASPEPLEPEYRSFSLSRGVPIAVDFDWRLPRCFSRQGRAELSHEVHEFLQSRPPAPLKPPHSRFHPLPTQPVFASRAEYSAPELLEPPAAPPPAELADAPPVEAIPIPLPDGEAPGAPWREQREEQPLPLSQPPMIDREARPSAPGPMLLAPPQPDADQGDASRGTIAPMSFRFVDEPNPLRASTRVSRQRLHR